MGPKNNCIESAPVESHTMGLGCGASLGASQRQGVRKDGGVGEYIKQATTIGRPAHMNKCLVGENAAGVSETYLNFFMSAATGGGRLTGPEAVGSPVAAADDAAADDDAAWDS